MKKQGNLPLNNIITGANLGSFFFGGFMQIINFLKQDSLSNKLYGTRTYTDINLVNTLSSIQDTLYKIYFSFFSRKLLKNEYMLNKLLLDTISIMNYLLNKNLLPLHKQFDFDKTRAYIFTYSEVNFYDMVILALYHSKSLKEKFLKSKETVFDENDTKDIEALVYTVTNLFINI